VWGIGAAATPLAMFCVVVATLVLAALLVHTGGFRASIERTLLGVLREAIEAVAVGVVAAVGVLVLLREITLASPLADALGKVVYEAAPFAIGAAVACHLFVRSRDEVDGEMAASDDRGSAGGTVADVGSTLVGALFVAFNIAPTEEVPRLAASSSPPVLLAIAAASLLVSYAIVFEAGFGDQASRREQRGFLQHPITETRSRTSWPCWRRRGCCSSSVSCTRVTPGHWCSITSWCLGCQPRWVEQRAGSRYERAPVDVDCRAGDLHRRRRDPGDLGRVDLLALGPAPRAGDRHRRAVG